MQITVHIQVQDDDTFNLEPSEAADTILNALNGDVENDLINVQIQAAPKSASIGMPPIAPVE